MNESLLANYRMQGHRDFEYHSHQEYEIYFFHEGSCRYLIQNKIYDLQPGDIMLMDGLELHKPNVNPNDPYVRSVVHFSPYWIKSTLEELGSMYLLEPFQKLHQCLIRTNGNSDSKRLEKIFARLTELKRKDNKNDHLIEMELKVLLIQALIIVYQLGQKDSMKIENRSDKTDHVENIATFIKDNYMQKLTLDKIANALNLSKSYVSHVYKEMTGFTVMEYVMGCRLTQVKYLLEMEPKKSLKDIAFECGFESVSHFSRYFREKVGVTAKEYRNLRIQIFGKER
ncbi:AraC family transcriptional regulator [Radiobacillus sp. PE A8.2]|uniref:helix-turn-helix transcriptional regulator n=1 Tax=Radiobacillus sp. PE A8.2 TaxID=3380349 RepID=UPI003891170A